MKISNWYTQRVQRLLVSQACIWYERYKQAIIEKVFEEREARFDKPLFLVQPFQLKKTISIKKNHFK
jgi:hypothetical protein